MSSKRSWSTLDVTPVWVIHIQHISTGCFSWDLVLQSCSLSFLTSLFLAKRPETVQMAGKMSRMRVSSCSKCLFSLCTKKNLFSQKQMEPKPRKASTLEDSRLIQGMSMRGMSVWCRMMVECNVKKSSGFNRHLYLTHPHQSHRIFNDLKTTSFSSLFATYRDPTSSSRPSPYLH